MYDLNKNVNMFLVDSSDPRDRYLSAVPTAFPAHQHTPNQSDKLIAAMQDDAAAIATAAADDPIPNRGSSDRAGIGPAPADTPHVVSLYVWLATPNIASPLGLRMPFSIIRRRRCSGTPAGAIAKEPSDSMAT